MINSSDALTIQLLLQSSPQQEITGLRSRLFDGQFPGLINSGTLWERRITSRVIWRQRYADASSCWKISQSEICRMSGNNLFKDFSTITPCLLLLTDVWKRLTFSKFYYSRWTPSCFVKKLSALQQSFIRHDLLCTHICVHNIILWICRHLGGEIFRPQSRYNQDFIFLATFSDAHKQQVF